MIDNSSDNGDGDPESKISEIYDESVTVQTTPVNSFDSFPGYEEQKEKLRQLVVEPSQYDRYATSSVLLFGENVDCRTTELAKGLTGEVEDGYTFFVVNSFSGEFGEDRNNIEATLETARHREPSLVILDCLDEYSFDEEEYERLLSHLESIRTNNEQMIVVGAATGIDTDLAEYDSVFEVTIEVPEPDDLYQRGVIEAEMNRAEAAGVIEIDDSGEESVETIDTHSLSLHELRTAVKRTVQRRRREAQVAVPTVSPTHIQESIGVVETERIAEPGGMSMFDETEDEDQFNPDVPDVSFDDIGGLTEEKNQLRSAVTKPVEYSDTFRAAGYSVGQGIVLHGPPGNGKTMLAKAVANELSYRFLSVKGPELEQPLVGETERQLRALFEAAREHTPSVVFFDEFDSLAPSRADDTPIWKDDLVNTLLSELDGLEPLDDVIVLAATNRLDKIDDAVLRSGRFDTFIEVPPPDIDAQRAIFDVHIEDLPAADSVTASWFGTLDIATLSGADIATVCRKSLERAVRNFDTGDAESLEVSQENVISAIEQLRSGPVDSASLPEFQ